MGHVCGIQRVWGCSAQVCVVIEFPGVPLMMEGCSPGIVPKEAWGLASFLPLTVLVTLLLSGTYLRLHLCSAHRTLPSREEAARGSTHHLRCLCPVIGHCHPALFFKVSFFSKPTQSRGSPACLPPLVYSSLFYDFVLKTIGLGCNNTDVFASQENHEFPLLSPQ